MEKKRNNGEKAAADNLIYYPYKGVRQPMSLYARAAQFSPFAALTGYDELIADSSAAAEERREVSEDKAAHINECLRMIMESYPHKLKTGITRFVRDKHGGAYETVRGLVRQIDESAGTVVFDDNRAVPIADIYDIFFENFRNKI